MKKKEVLILLLLAVLVTFFSSQFLTECANLLCLPDQPTTCKRHCHYLPSIAVLRIVAGEYVRLDLFPSLLLGAMLWFVVLVMGWWMVEWVGRRYGRNK